MSNCTSYWLTYPTHTHSTHVLSYAAWTAAYPHVTFLGAYALATFLGAASHFSRCYFSLFSVHMCETFSAHLQNVCLSCVSYCFCKPSHVIHEYVDPFTLSYLSPRIVGLINAGSEMFWKLPQDPKTFFWRVFSQDDKKEWTPVGSWRVRPNGKQVEDALYSNGANDNPINKGISGFRNIFGGWSYCDANCIAAPLGFVGIHAPNVDAPPCRHTRKKLWVMGVQGTIALRSFSISFLS